MNIYRGMLHLSTIESYKTIHKEGETADILQNIINKACDVISTTTSEGVRHQLINIILENSECRLYVLHCLLDKDMELEDKMISLGAALLVMNPEITLQVIFTFK